jgi:ribose 5-phosphate isomerase B
MLYTLFNMIIHIATDHAGFEYKEYLKDMLQKSGFVVEDYGAKVFDAEDDYTDYISPCVSIMIKKTNKSFENGFAIVLGGSGTGEAIAANRARGARAVICNSNNLEIIKLGRQHNNANVLSIGARFVSREFAFQAVQIFMESKFEGGKHLRRVMKLDTKSL